MACGLHIDSVLGVATGFCEPFPAIHDGLHVALDGGEYELIIILS